MITIRSTQQKKNDGTISKVYQHKTKYFKLAGFKLITHEKTAH